MGSFGGAFDSPVVASAIAWGGGTLERRRLHQGRPGDDRRRFPADRLYTLFGPADGNPICLGLLMVVLVPVGFLLAGVGVMRLLIA